MSATLMGANQTDEQCIEIDGCGALRGAAAFLEVSMDDMKRRFRRDCRRAVLMRVAQCVAVALVFVLIAAAMMSLTGCASRVTATEKANGMPLDAASVTEYDCPVWLSGCSHAYKVVDRQTGESWWLLVMHEGTKTQDYVVLPCEGAK